MKPFAKWSLIIGGVLVLGLLLVVLLVPAFIDAEQFRPMIEARASEALGRKVTLVGDVSVSIFPWTGLTFSELTVANPDGFSEPVFVSVDAFEAKAKLFPLLGGDLQVRRIVLNRPKIVLEIDKEGRANWEGIGQDGGHGTAEDGAADSGAAKTPEESGEGFTLKNFQIGEVAVTGGELLWIDGRAGERRSVSDLRLRLTDISPKNPIEVAFSAVVDAQPIALNGSIGPLGDAVGETPLPLKLTLEALDLLELSVEGSVTPDADEPSVDLVLASEPFSPRELLRRLEIPFPVTTTDPEALSRLSFKAGVKGNASAFTVSDANIGLDGSQIDLSLDVPDLEQPKIVADMRVDTLDLNRYLPPAEATTAESGPDKPPAEAAPFPPPLLKTLILNAKLHCGDLKTPAGRFSSIDLNISGEKGRFDIALSGKRDGHAVAVESRVGPFDASSPLRVTITGPEPFKLSLDGTLRNLNKNPSVDGQVSLSPFSPRKLAADLGFDFPVETTDPKVLGNLAFQGNISASAGSIKVSKGRLTLDQSMISFSLDAPSLSPPNIRFDTDIDRIDIDRYLPPATGQASGSAAPATSGKGTDYTPLRALTLDGKAAVKQLTAGGNDIRNLGMAVSAEKGQIRLSRLNLNIFGGQISLNGTTDVRKATPAIRFNLTGKGLDAATLMRQTGRKEILEGTAALDLALSGVGDTAEALRRTLDGKGNFTFTNGAIKGVDLTRMARNVKVAFQRARGEEIDRSDPNLPRTDFSELRIDFTAENGLVAVSDAALVSPFIRASANGTVNLVSEALDLRITPKFVATVRGKGDRLKRAGIIFPVLVGGKLGEPTFRPDVAGMIRDQISEEDVAEILKDPEEGLKKVVEEKGKALKEIFRHPKSGEKGEDAGKTQKERPDESPDDSEDKRKPVEKAVDELLKNLPFGPPK